MKYRELPPAAPEVNRRLHAYLAGRRINQVWLAGQLGVTHVALNRKIRASTKTTTEQLTADDIRAIADALDLRPSLRDEWLSLLKPIDQAA